jgi:hypothetical protein
MACQAGVIVFWTVRQREQIENSAVPDAGWTSEETK